jgi:hypothetical protein
MVGLLFERMFSLWLILYFFPVFMSTENARQVPLSALLFENAIVMDKWLLMPDEHPALRLPDGFPNQDQYIACPHTWQLQCK